MFKSKHCHDRHSVEEETNGALVGVFTIRDDGPSNVAADRKEVPCQVLDFINMESCFELSVRWHDIAVSSIIIDRQSTIL
ncbi:hypothetical protein KIN20_016218 [Parelaphostrongylus tenuis]|uniref:Uncharacterized protein n=1 Tax=Parelaphostrongylus tenuis TaxID=148309 RepID=A0AAD5QPL9_PARTN|nr:hypothetical protein KIN20_016218 [Parelaphostrongylus tenuis]